MQDGGTGPDEVLDLVGVGFGPSNLGLAIAVAERAGPALTARFVERQERFGWHCGMLLEDATMQVSFLKDLVTLRNPASEYSFLSYLHERERLVDFINYGSPFPTRIEFHDYLEWAAAGFSDLVDYGFEVERITAVPGEPGLLDVHGQHSHGLSSTLLSTIAVRAGEIADSIASDGRAREAHQSCADRADVLPVAINSAAASEHAPDLD
jgi:lysine/ornithine N-monooxygenase